MGRHVPHRGRPGRAGGPGGAPAPTTGSPSAPPDGGAVPVATTRPELLPACVALVATPDDERYARLFGTTVRTPLFGVEVPVLAHHLADPGKGTGIAMVCTFGDATDVTWWRELGLPARPVTGQGRALPGPPARGDHQPGRARRLPAAGRRRRRRPPGSGSPACCARAGDLLGEPRAGPARGEVLREGQPAAGDHHQPAVVPAQRRPRPGAARRPCWPGAGRSTGIPPHMRVRYENWVNGLTSDWLVSRQRFFGVPIPVWYPLDAEGQPRYDEPIMPPGRRPAGRSDGRHAARVRRRPSAASPAGSPATRT